MDSRHKGRIAELKVELRAAEKKIVLSRPTTDARYDFIVDDGRLMRVQVKYGDGQSFHSANAVRVDLRRWKGWPQVMTKTYSRSEVDALFVYVPQLDKILMFGPDIFEGKTSLTLRLRASANNQKKGVFLADDFIW